MPKIQFPSLLVGILIGWLLLPMVISFVTGKGKSKG